MNINWVRLETTAQWVAIVALGLLGVTYAGDYLYVRARVSGADQGASQGANGGSDGIYGSVKVQRYWEIPQKNGKTDYSFDPPSEQTCIHSIFPHGGYSPCWYLSRHRMVRMSWNGDQESLHAAARIVAVSAACGRVPKV
jgi:hypothetical protein